QRPLDLEHRTVERDRRGTAAQEPVLDDERVSGDREVGPVPASDGQNRDHSCEREEDCAGRSGGSPRGEEARSSSEREDERTEERARERDPMAMRLEKWRVHVGFVLLPEGNPWGMGGTARRAATATLVALSIVVAALALWKIRIVIALLFLGFVIASAMRPGVEWLNRRARVPRSAGVVLHYLVFLAAIGLVLYVIVPVAITQIDHAIVR